MIRANDEPAAPEIQPPMLNCEDQADELAFVGGELRVAKRDRLAKERHRAATLVKHRTEA